MKCVAVIVAAGSGARFGSDIPKQFLPLGKKPIWQWSYETLSNHPRVDDVIIVLPRGETIKGAKVAEGGPTRAESVLNGLNALAPFEDTVVLIHDAARPGLSARVIDELLSVMSHCDAAAPRLPVNDALKRGDHNPKTVDRANLWRVQTPQAFRLNKIRAALQDSDLNFIDDLQAIEQQGGKVQFVPGSERLCKITRPEDLDWLSEVLVTTEIRTGFGFDVHAFEAGDHVTLCGVEIPHTAKLQGHSDADVAWHALTDAILGAIALGDIGDHFPPTESKWKNAKSSIFLRHAYSLARERGYAISNIDITIICESPKIKPHRDTMRNSTANCLEIEIDRVSVKATTTEGLGFTGRREGIAAQANISLARQIKAVD